MFIPLHETVLCSYQNCRLRVPSTFDILSFLREALSGYDDFIVVEFLEFGWPVNYTKMEMPVTSFRNHKSALYNEEHIDKYIESELKYSALIGPFDQNPFSAPSTTSLLMSVLEHNSVERRILIDLSFSSQVSTKPQLSLCLFPIGSREHN